MKWRFLLALFRISISNLHPFPTSSSPELYHVAVVKPEVARGFAAAAGLRAFYKPLISSAELSAFDFVASLLALPMRRPTGHPRKVVIGSGQEDLVT